MVGYRSASAWRRWTPTVGLSNLTRRWRGTENPTVVMPYLAQRRLKNGNLTTDQWLGSRFFTNVGLNFTKRRSALGYLPTLGLNIWRMIVYILILDLKPIFKTHTHKTMIERRLKNGNLTVALPTLILRWFNIVKPMPTYSRPWRPFTDVGSTSPCRLGCKCRNIQWRQYFTIWVYYYDILITFWRGMFFFHVISTVELYRRSWKY
jgi:hypothetical protein